jgi:MoaA/NifB/PqqE/SkfB family radical SAM enzyme
MNLAINGTCAKGCSFCFTKEDARLKHTLGEMSIEKVGELLDHFDIEGSREEVTILGGEPTQHSNFMGLMDYIISRGYKVNLVSNLLFGKRTLDYITNNIKHIRWILPNGAELDEKNRLNLFKKNYLSLYSTYANTWGFEDNSRLFIAITLSSDWKERKMFEYIKWLYHALDGKLNAIRLGLDLTGTYLINNKEMGKEVTKILKFGLYNNIQVTSDCQVPPCLWEGGNKQSIMENSLGFATFKIPGYDKICGFMPLDIFPDGSSIHCYPLQDKVKIDNVLKISGENNILSLRDKFDDLYRENHKDYSIPQDCLDCVFYKTECNGICGGCLENE